MGKAKSKISDFRPQKENANKHTARGMGMLDNSISQGGWMGAMTSAADGEIFDGSARLETAYDRFGEEIEPIVIDADGTRPIIVRRTDIPSANDPKARKLSIAANRIAPVNLDWDPEVLKAIGEEIDISDLFYDNEIDDLFEKLEEGQEWEPEEEDEEVLAESLDNIGKVESRVKLGEIWQLGRHKIACGDSTIEANVRALLGDRLGDVGMVWSDPPYGMRLDADYSDMPTNKDKSWKGGKCHADVIGDHEDFDPRPTIELFNKVHEQFWWGADYYAERIPNKNDGSWFVWDKRVEDQFDKMFGSGFELVWSRKKHKRDLVRIRWAGVFGMQKEDTKGRIHPTQKPTDLCVWFFEKYGNDNDLIFDPFLGVAPSIIAAQKMEGDRTVYGLELSPDYCQVIIERYENFTGDIARLVGTL